jgi:hypothetical protein
VTGPIGLVVGEVDMSLQLLECSGPQMFDVGISGELGAALAEQVDLMIVNGAGSTASLWGC